MEKDIFDLSQDVQAFEGITTHCLSGHGYTGEDIENAEFNPEHGTHLFGGIDQMESAENKIKTVLLEDESSDTEDESTEEDDEK